MDRFCILMVCLVVSSFGACLDGVDSNSSAERLPIIGEREVDENGKTIYHKIPDFNLLNQNGKEVSNEDFSGKIYVADFFFIHCPTICPKVTKQMLRIHDEFKDEPRLVLVAHTVDPKHDTIAALYEYARKLGVKAPKWHFLRGENDEVAELAEEYFSVVIKNPDAPGGIDHSGRIILVDEDRHVRSFANGTDPDEVERLIKDIKILLNKKS